MHLDLHALERVYGHDEKLLAAQQERYARALDEFARRYGPGEVNPDWAKARNGRRPERYSVVFSPASYTLALDEALEQAGVDLWLDTLVCAPVMDGRRVAGVEVETKTGRGVIRAKCVVDATGDADLAFRAGAECIESQNWPALWAFELSIEIARRAAESGKGLDLLRKVVFGKGGAGPLAPPEGGFYGTRGEEVTRFVLDGRRRLREHYRARYAEGHDRHTLFPMTLPAMAQYRTTRAIVGRTTLVDGDAGRRFADSVGMVADWRKTGSIWEVPYGSLLPSRVEGLLAAGRCTASHGDAWHVTRVIPACSLTGQVCGVAAGLAVQRACLPDELPAETVQDALRKRGVLLHIDELPALAG